MASQRNDLDERLVLDVPELGVALVELATGGVRRANAAFLELIGATSSSAVAGAPGGERIELFAHGTAELRAALESLRAAGRTPPLTTRFEQPGTEARAARTRDAWITGVALPAARPDAPRELALLYALDVTEQRRTVEALRESDERARRLAAASFEGLFIHDAGVIVDVNDAIPAMFGSSREAMIGRHAMEFTHPSCHAVMMENVRRQYELPYELVGVRSDGTLFPIEVLGKPIPFAGERMRVTAVRDLTERKRTEGALREAESALQRAQKLESLGLLAGGIAHDFNNLLAVITAYAAIARRDVAPSSRTADALGEIERAARRAADLTRQMLVYSGRSPKEVGAIALDDVVRDIAQLITASFPKKIALELELAGDLPEIAADRAQIEQVVMNLLTNAAEAIGEARGEVRVRTRAVAVGRDEIESAVPGEHLPEGRYLELTVADDGRGMDAATLARIFDPFFTTKETGRGLGLSAMLGILRGHRAGLTIDTEPGRGSTFRVLLPANRPAAPPEKHAGEAARADPRADGDARPVPAVVLIAEDEPALRRATREVLAAAGHRVLEAVNGAEAIDLFRRHASDVGVVLLDLEMPIAGGREALEGIRAIDPHARVVLTSGFDAHEVLDGLRGEGVGFVAKPWSAEDLLAAIARAARGPA